MTRAAADWAMRGVLAALLLYGLSALPDFAGRWGVSSYGVAAVVAWIALAAIGYAALRTAPRATTLVGLAAVVIALRIAFALLAAGRASPGDPTNYLNLAKGLLAGRGLVVYDPYLGGAWRALFPPLYPLLLAGWGAVAGFSTPAVLALGTLTDLGVAWAIVRLGAVLGGPLAARRAAWLSLVWPSVLFSAPLAQKESLCTLLVLLLALAWLVPRPGWRGALALGVPAGLLALAQPGEAPLAALFGLALIGRRGVRTVIASGLRGAAVAAVVLLPWWIRNALLFHAFVPLTTASGPSLWIGNNPEATGNWMPPPPTLRGVPEPLYGPRAAALARAWIAAHPLGFARLTLAKLVRACALGVFGVVRLQAMTLPTRLLGALWPLAHLSHLALLGGAAARVGRVPVALPLLIAACGAQLALFGVWFEFGERHREFVTPFLLLVLCWPVEKPVAAP